MSRPLICTSTLHGPNEFLTIEKVSSIVMQTIVRGAVTPLLSL
jgi:hypothetical protein